MQRGIEKMLLKGRRSNDKLAVGEQVYKIPQESAWKWFSSLKA